MMDELTKALVEIWDRLELELAQGRLEALNAAMGWRILGRWPRCTAMRIALAADHAGYAAEG